MIKIIEYEMKHCKIIILLFTIILVLILTLSAVFSTVAFNCLKVTDDIVKTYSEESEFEFYIDNVGSNTSQFLDNLKCDSVCYNFNYKKLFDDNTELLIDNVKMNETIFVVSPKDKVSKELTDDRLLRGTGFNSKNSTNVENSVWITKSISIKYNIDISDIIIVSNGNTILKFKIVGIYSDIESIPPLFVNLNSANNTLRKFGISTKKSVVIIQSSYSSCRELVSKLKEKGVYYTSESFEIVDGYFEYYYLFFSVLGFISFIVICIAMTIFFTYTRLILIQRKQFINMLLTLGVSKMNVVIIYCSILEIVIMISILMCIISVKILYRYITSVVSSMFEIVFFDVIFPYSAFAYTLIIMNVFMLAVSAYLYAKLTKVEKYKNFRGNT